MAERIADAERDLGRDVNLVSYERDEIERLRGQGDRFAESVFAGPRIPLVSQTRSS